MSISDEELIEMAGLSKAKTGPKPKPKKAKKKSKKLKPTPPSIVAEANQTTPTRGLRNKKERSRDLVIALEQEGYDPVSEIFRLMSDSDDDSISDLERVKVNLQLLPYMYQKQKSVEIKEEKDWTINIVNRNFAVNDDGEVVDV